MSMEQLPPPVPGTGTVHHAGVVPTLALSASKQPLSNAGIVALLLVQRACLCLQDARVRKLYY